MATKGAILKNRIKECGYTQELFADKAGISLSALKKYISNKTIYDCNILLVFAELLDCSLDYLMGLTDTPKRELQTVKDMTGLSDEVIEYIQNLYTLKDNKANMIMIKTINAIIGDSELMNRLMMYLYGYEVDELNELYNAFKELLQEDLVGMNSATLTSVIEELAVLKTKL